MSSWYNNLINKTSSGIRGFLQAEADGDTEDDTHVCRVLRSYYGEKGRALPSWLPPDPRAPPPPVIPVNTGPAIGARYGGLSNGQNAAGGGGFSSLWDTPSNGSQQQQPQSLRQGGGRPAFGAQQSTGARQSPFAPQQNAQQQDNRPGIQKGGGSYQNTYREASTPAPNGGGSAQDRLKQRLWGGARTTSPQSASGGPFQPPPQQQQQQQQQHLVAAAASVAQQQHFNRLANHGPMVGISNTHVHDTSHEMVVSEDNRRTMAFIADLLNENTREAALLELSKKREQVQELALILWHSFGVMTSLLQEIISVYTLLSPSQLTAAASNRVCNALALLQCVASHNETRTLFLNAHIPLYLYPFLNTTSKSRPFEYLRLTSLGVIGALVKNDSSEVINFLLTTEIIPLCLRIMETGSELSKTVAIFIVQKILLDDNGLNYICATYERFYAVGTVLSNMVTQLVEQQTARLLKHVVRCFLRLSDNARAREALRQCLPEPLRDATFSAVLRDDAATKRCLAQLLINLTDPSIEHGAGAHNI